MQGIIVLNVTRLGTQNDCLSTYVRINWDPTPISCIWNQQRVVSIFGGTPHLRLKRRPNISSTCATGRTNVGPPLQPRHSVKETVEEVKQKLERVQQVVINKNNSLRTSATPSNEAKIIELGHRVLDVGHRISELS